MLFFNEKLKISERKYVLKNPPYQKNDAGTPRELMGGMIGGEGAGSG